MFGQLNQSDYCNQTDIYSIIITINSKGDGYFANKNCARSNGDNTRPIRKESRFGT